MEVCPLARGMMSPNGSTPIRPITEWLSLPPSSFTRNPINSPYGSPSLFSGEVTGLPRSASIPTDGLGAVSSPVGLYLRQETPNSLNWPTCLLAQAYQRLWLVCNNDVYQQFTSVHLTIHPGSRPPWRWQSQPLLTIRLPSSRMRLRCPSRSLFRLVGYQIAEYRVTSCCQV